MQVILIICCLNALLAALSLDFTRWIIYKLCIKCRPSGWVQQKSEIMCDIFRVDCAIRKDYYLVIYAGYAIFSSTILSSFYQDSDTENHVCAALTKIVIKISKIT